LLDVLDKDITMELPPSLVKAESDAIKAQQDKERAGHDHTHDHGHDHDDALSDEEIQKIAERRVKLGLVLADFGEKNAVRVTDDEVHRAILAEAQKYPGYQRQVLEYYKDNAQAIASIRAPLYEDKIIAHMFERVALTTKTVSPDVFKDMEDKDLEQYENDAPKPKKAAKAKAPSTDATAEKPKKAKKAKGE
jgi:trigger factor